MTRRRAIRRTCAAALGVAVVAMLAPVWMGARAVTLTTSAQLSAMPASDLADGQFVKLSFSGFTPSIGIAFRQCIPSPVTVATDCAPQNTQVTGVTDSTGAGTVYLPIRAGKLTTTGGTATIPCDVADPCVIAAMPSLTDLATAVFVPVTFARSKDDCPPPPADSVLGSGSSSAYRAVYAWESAVCIPPENLSVGYTLSNSSDGMSNFLNGLTDFAVTGPFTTIPTPIVPTSQTYRFAPLTSSAVVLAYRMYDNSGPQIVSLTLTPDLIAQIFLGQIPNWAANAQIRALNPGVLFPTRIIPSVRAEHSAQSLVFTSWLAANAPTTWKAGATDIFPIPASGVQGVTGSTGLGYAVADPLTDWLGQGNIGFMDSSTAAFYGLPAVTVKRADGSLMTPTPTAITQAIVDATTNADGTLAMKYADPNPNAYSMTMPTYMMAPTNTIAPARGAVLAGYLSYAVQNQGSLPQGYAPLPPSLVAESLQVAAAIPTTPPPTATPSPTAKGTSTPAPAHTSAPTRPPASRHFTPSTGTGLAGVLPPPPAAPPAPPVVATQPVPKASASPTGEVAAASSAQPQAALRFTDIGDSTSGRYLLLGGVILGLLSLVAGTSVEVAARRQVHVGMTPDEAGA